MYEHFGDRFPELTAAIDALVRWDDALRVVLSDYEEISTWLAAQQSGSDAQPEELERARDLARDLEKEILKHLEKQNDKSS